MLAALLRTIRRLISRTGSVPPIRPNGGELGLPADLLLDQTGIVVAAKYGARASDQWTVDELLLIGTNYLEGLRE